MQVIHDRALVRKRRRRPDPDGLVRLLPICRSLLVRPGAGQEAVR